MTENLVSYFAFSLAGHDKGKVYYIAGEDDIYVYLSDGDLKPLDSPKKKKKKHIRLIKTRKELSTDSEVKRALKEIKQDVES